MDNNETVENKDTININRICRFCADINTKLYPIFENKYEEKLKSFINIEIFSDDGLPDMICALCKYKLNTAYEFKLQILSVDRKLRDLLLNDELTELNDSQLSVNESSLESKKSVHSDEVIKLIEVEKDKKVVEVNEIVKIVDELQEEETISKLNDCKLKRKNDKKRYMEVTCPECGRSIKKHCLTDHLKTHTRIPDRECPICGVMLLTRAALYHHKKWVHGKREPINCDQCGKNFATNSSFKVHQRNVHLNIKKYQCEICKKCFGLPKTLKHHMQVHTGDRPYVCQHCGRAVSSQFALKQHIRLHTNETPYKCKDCGEGFKQNITMKLHYRRVHLGITPEEDKLTKLSK